MPRYARRPLLERRYWMLMTQELTGKSAVAIRKAIYRMGMKPDLAGFCELIRRYYGIRSR